MDSSEGGAPLLPGTEARRGSLQDISAAPRSALTVALVVAAHALAVATFLIILVLIIQTYRPEGGLVFGSLGTHALCMVSAFGLLSPVATLAYQTYESLLGVSHATAKGIHATLQTAALVCGLVGFAAM